MLHGHQDLHCLLRQNRPDLFLAIITCDQSIYIMDHHNLTVSNIVENYSKTRLKQPLKIDEIKVLTTNGSLMKVESIAECSLGAFCNTFDLH